MSQEGHLRTRIKELEQQCDRQITQMFEIVAGRDKRISELEAAVRVVIDLAGAYQSPDDEADPWRFVGKRLAGLLTTNPGISTTDEASQPLTRYEDAAIVKARN